MLEVKNLKRIKPIRTSFWIMILLMIIFTAVTYGVEAEKDCLDYSIKSGEPIMLIGVHPFFYGSTSVNHYVNYKIIDNETIEIHDYKNNRNSTMSIRSWDEIRQGVFHDGFNYYKLFINQQPQRYWRRMI